MNIFRRLTMKKEEEKNCSNCYCKGGTICVSCNRQNKKAEHDYWQPKELSQVESKDKCNGCSKTKLCSETTKDRRNQYGKCPMFEVESKE